MNKEERLREYINKDYSYINYKTGVKDGTDFDKFCIQHCKDIEELLEENKKQKELIDTILNLNIFKKECPMNFGYDEETNEDKAQDVFYKDDDYCENNCNDDYTKCWLKYFKRMHELEKGDSND